MARLPGLFQRGVVYQLRVIVPLDLRPLYAGRSKLVHSLGTSDWREAERLGAQVRADLLEEFAERRRALRPRPVADFPPGLGTTLGARVHQRLLRWDAQMRGDPALADLWLRFIDAFGFTTLTRLGQGPPAVPALPSAQELARLAPHSPFDGLTPAQLARLAELNSATEDGPDRPPAPRSLAALTVIADSEARKLGLLVDWTSPEARPVMLDCLRAYRAAHADIVKRNEGQDVVVTPQAPVKAARKAPVKLRDVFRLWQGAKKRADDSVRACERALALFEQRTGDPPVQAITRAQGEDFRAWLQTLGTSSKDADGATVKAAAGLRRVPVHRGINAFHKAATKNEKAPVFHELRHTVRAGLLAAEVDRETIGGLMGHEPGLLEVEKASTRTSDMELRAAVEALGFPAVKLRRVYR